MSFFVVVQSSRRCVLFNKIIGKIISNLINFNLIIMSQRKAMLMICLSRLMFNEKNENLIFLFLQSRVFLKF